MKLDDVRAERLGLLDRMRVHRGRCPTCGNWLIEEEGGDSISTWTHIPEKYVIRVGGRRMMDTPVIHNVNVARSRRCTACGRWYVGRWAYHEIREQPTQPPDSPAG